ncbi:hypothetical protein S83_019171, partial [Arachis hypogaea]
PLESHSTLVSFTPAGFSSFISTRRQPFNVSPPSLNYSSPATKATRRVVGARHLLISGLAVTESPWIMDHRGVVARRLAVSGSRCHRVAVDR